MNKIVVVGGGSGTTEYILPIGLQIIESAEYVVADKRIADNLDRKDIIILGKISDTVDEIRELVISGTVAVVVSGDPLMYSLYKVIRDKLSEIEVQVIPGVSSLQMLGCKVGVTMENSKIISMHGREVMEGVILKELRKNDSLFFLCSKENNPSHIAKLLLKHQVSKMKMYVGACLNTEDEQIDEGTLEEIANREYSDLCVVCVKNTEPYNYLCHNSLLRDEEFCRNNTPMTKEEIRAIVLMKLQLRSNQILWDIGAGTGSICVEMARLCENSLVYAVECKEEAVDIINKNRDKFNLHNLSIVKGKGGEVMKELPLPDGVFIGGSGNELEVILKYLSSIDKKVRVVISAVTLETFTKAYELCKNMVDFEMVQVTVSQGKPLGNYNILSPNNPVFILGFNTK